jgi:hypothetical protein
MLSSELRVTYDSLKLACPREGLVAGIPVLSIVVSIQGAEFNPEPFIRGRGRDALPEVDTGVVTSVVGESQRAGTLVAYVDNIG